MMLKLVLFATLVAFSLAERVEEAPPPLEEQMRPEDLPHINGYSTIQCTPKAVDLVFVVDQSGSIGSRSFATVRAFLQNVAAEFQFPLARMGVVEFNTYATRWFSLNSYSTQSAIQSAIGRMPYQGGGTSIATGMNYATRYMFTSGRGDRNDVDDVMVVITDGQDSSNVVAASAAAEAKKIKRIAIGVGNGVRIAELAEITGGDRNLVFQVGSFNNLTGIVGTLCQEIETACDRSPCQNEATCTEINSGADYVCTCSSAWTGPECETPVDPCHSGPCHNEGTCNVGGISYTCNCTEDYSGETCDVFIDPCDSNPCHNGASCERLGPTSHKCYCPVGFTGAACDTEICQHGGTFSCDCPYGYFGDLCQNRVDFCNATEYIFNGTFINVNICGVHGACTNTPEGPHCDCDAGWFGDYCQKDVNDCSDGTCQNGGTCFNLPGPGYVCNCDKLHTGQNCEEDIDLCNRVIIHAVTGNQLTVPICGDHGTCEQNDVGAVCHCDAGWTGPYCDTEIPTSCSYKGETHLHNTTWTDHCDDCNCQFGVVQCARSNWCPKRCAIYDTPQTLAQNITAGCPLYQNCVPEDVTCAHETPSCDFPAGWCFPVGYVIVDPRLPPNFHPPKSA